MTQTQRELPAEVSRKTSRNCGSRKKSACVEKSTRFTLSAQFKIVPQLHPTVLKFQPVTEINESMAANLLPCCPDTLNSHIFG